MTAIIKIESPWGLRVPNAEKYYKAWETKYKCSMLYQYYQNFQWKTNGQSTYRPYTNNVIYATIKSKIANLLYQNPEFDLSPVPGGMDWDQDVAFRSALLKQDMLNTVIANPQVDMTEDIKLACLDAFFRFAVIEVGYSATWDNPNKQPVYTKKHDDPTSDSDKVINDPEVPLLEQVYFKRIPAKRFRVSASDSPKLVNCNWCGYYEFIPKTTLINTPGIKVPANFKDAYYSVDFADAMQYFQQTEMSEDVLKAVQNGEICKVWRIWDNVSKKKLLLLDGDFFEMWSATFERLPFQTYRFDIDLENGWYPIPPVWQWISSQDEINESREQMRRYRRRFTRKFQYVKGSVESDELDKMKSEIDGEMIETKLEGAIAPIINPDLGAAIVQGLVTAKDDFDIITGRPVSRGRASDRQTATAVNQLAAEEKIREDIEQLDFSKFMCSIGREALLCIGERFSEPIWVKLTQDNENSILEEMQVNQDAYKQVFASDIQDGYDFRIRMRVTDASPAQMQKEEQSFIKFMTMLNTYPQMALSPTLITEGAFRCGYRNLKVIKEAQKMAMLLMMEKVAQAQATSVMSQAMGGQSGNQNNTAKGIYQRGQANSPDEIQSQLQGQLG